MTFFRSTDNKYSSSLSRTMASVPRNSTCGLYEKAISAKHGLRSFLVRQTLPATENSSVSALAPHDIFYRRQVSAPRAFTLAQSRGTVQPWFGTRPWFSVSEYTTAAYLATVTKKIKTKWNKRPWLLTDGSVVLKICSLPPFSFIPYWPLSDV